ncbi:acylphosphatase-2 isoform X2 [Camelus bactrianus]|uniref:Acylphosphatase-2 isoform X2 n=1 Tax=Camelus bactrianus TaxID=9837 RepID=A0AC58NHH9_CAMBA
MEKARGFVFLKSEDSYHSSVMQNFQERNTTRISKNGLQLPGAASHGVCFRMYTEDEARKIGVVGWVKNTSKGTVTGQVQGPEEKVNSMKSWLSKVGSPSSRIDRTNFSNEKSISKLEYSNFSIRY